MAKIDQSLFSLQEPVSATAFGACPVCEAPLTIRNSKKGAFYGCSDYPSCDFTKPLNEQPITQVKVIEGSHCPNCNETLAVKSGRFGLFIGCTAFPECNHIEPIKTSAQNSEQPSIKVDCP
jgi:putative DNA topoisomerase